MKRICSTERQRMLPIPIAEFSEYVRKKHQNSNIELEDEFEVSY